MLKTKEPNLCQKESATNVAKTKMSMAARHARRDILFVNLACGKLLASFPVKESNVHSATRNSGSGHCA